MKQLIKSKQLKMVLIVLIIIAGIAMIAVKGFNFDLKYQDAQKIQLNLGKEFDNNDIKTIAKEQLNGQKIMINKVEEFEDTVDITAKEINDEAKNNIITKINEKYETEINSETITVENVKHVRGRDLIKPYIIPFAIATITILVYIAIRYSKLGWAKTTLATIGILVLSQAVLFSVMAITRLPIGRLTIPLVIIVYLITLMGITNKLEEKLKNKKQEENK